MAARPVALSEGQPLSAPAAVCEARAISASRCSSGHAAMPGITDARHGSLPRAPASAHAQRAGAAMPSAPNSAASSPLPRRAVPRLAFAAALSDTPPFSLADRSSPGAATLSPLQLAAGAILRSAPRFLKQLLRLGTPQRPSIGTAPTAVETAAAATAAACSAATATSTAATASPPPPPPPPKSPAVSAVAPRTPLQLPSRCYSSVSGAPSTPTTPAAPTVADFLSAPLPTLLPAAVALVRQCQSPQQQEQEQRRGARRQRRRLGSACPMYVERRLPPEGLLALWRGTEARLGHREWSLSHFQMRKLLHKGYASYVYKATCLLSSQSVVLKTYDVGMMDPFLLHQALRELDVHSRLEHAHVCQLMAAFREGTQLVLVLEYVKGGSLARALDRVLNRPCMGEHQALDIVVRPLLAALSYLHRQGIVHRDLKPENLLLTPDWRLKLCDFGVATCLLDERAVTRTGSRGYMAPEVTLCPLKYLPADNKDAPHLAYGTAVDVWSLGAMLYRLLVGFAPVMQRTCSADSSSSSRSSNNAAAAAALKRAAAAPQLPFPSSVSAEARSFVTACLCSSPAERPTIMQLLAHPWVSRAAVSAAAAMDAAGAAQQQQQQQQRGLVCKG